MSHLTIAQKADTVATFRHVSVYLMETLARWTPLTPQLEAKILFGRHLWEFAQHADVLGGRTSELRAGPHYTRPPVERYRRALEEFAAFETAGDRVHVIYDVVVPDLARRYAACLDAADPLLDQPTIRLMERIQLDLARVQAERREFLTGIPIPAANPQWVAELQSRLAAVPEFTDFRPAKGAAA
jgi:hypothetical protein